MASTLAPHDPWMFDELAEAFSRSYEGGACRRHLAMPRSAAARGRSTQLWAALRELLFDRTQSLGKALDSVVRCPPQLRPLATAVLARPGLAFGQPRAGSDAATRARFYLAECLHEWPRVDYPADMAPTQSASELGEMVWRCVARRGIKLGFHEIVDRQFIEFTREEVAQGDGLLAVPLSMAAQWAREAGLILDFWLWPARGHRCLLDAQLAMPEELTPRESLLWRQAIAAAIDGQARLADALGRVDWRESISAFNAEVRGADHRLPGGALWFDGATPADPCARSRVSPLSGDNVC